MKKTLRTLILTLGVLVTTGISSAVYAQDCNTINYKVVGGAQNCNALNYKVVCGAQDYNTLNCTNLSADSLQKICAEYGFEVPKCLAGTECLAVKSQVTSPCKTATCKPIPAKVTPTKAAPAKVTPVKAAPAKVTPVKAAPTKVAPSKTITPALTENNKLEQEVATLVNQERAKLGLAPLKLNLELSNVARTKSQDMATNNYFSHQSPTYGSPFDMMKSFGIKYMAAGENIAMGQPTAASVMNGWMNSPGHKANILNSNFTEIGVGVAKNSNGTIYWTQDFIGN